MKKILFILGFIMFAVFVSAVSWIGNNVVYTAQEDSVYHHNLSANVSSPASDMVFAVDTVNTKIYWNNTEVTYSTISSWIFIANSTTGDFVINATSDNRTGNFTIPFKVTYNAGADATTASFNFTINPINDAPSFVGLANQTFNISQLFSYSFSISDEENNTPFKINITFINCSTAQWSPRNSTNCTLFNSSQYTLNNVTGAVNISFTALKDDVGDYILNFTATDSGTISPANASLSRLINFSVRNVNSPPYFRYLCDNERNTSENAAFSCWINATDIDELSNLTFGSNYSWFTFNNSANSITSTSGAGTNYNASAMINFAPSDVNVGNWSVNISIYDTGSPIRRNSTVFWFFINNTEDAPTLNAISNSTLYENKTIYVNATDDDLLVPDKNVKNETLTFASNLSAVSISSFYSADNYTTARIIINYNSLTAGNHTVNVNATDSAGNTASRNFTVTKLSDNPAVWNQSSYVFVSYENNNTYLNLSTFISDVENDVINFSYTNDTIFPSFNLTLGIINFTSGDLDIGQHILSINASDGKLDSIIQFNLTIYNVNDIPFIETPLTVLNATVDASSNINLTEDNYTTITLWVQDNDFKIPGSQKGFYDEGLNLNLSLQGVNPSLFSFVRDESFPTSLNNRSKYEAVFTPRKADIGNYNITINITDLSNASTILRFNITITSVNHNPVLMNLTNYTSKVNAGFYLRINATDVEDGNSASGNNNFTFAYVFLNGTSFLNSSLFNSSSGEINITFNSSQFGRYRINITVNDTTNLTDSESFWIFVYNSPNITSPLTVNFTLQENATSSLGFMVNHSVGDNLTYDFYINNILRYNLSYYGNNTNLTWSFTPNFTDETYGMNVNLTLRVYPALYPELNYSQNWNMNISHTNYPLSFSGNIGGFNQILSGGSPQTATLSDYFLDSDASDRRINQTIGFVYSVVSGGSGITLAITNWTNGTTPSAVFSASSTSSGNFSIIGYEFNESNASQIIRNMTSNNFTVELTVSSTTTTAPSSGGGGGSTTVQVKLYNIRIILPGEIDLSDEKYIDVPFSVLNPGKVALSGINLSSSVVFNNLISDNLKINFFNDYIDELLPGNYKNMTLRISVGNKKAGRYRATVFANVTSPHFSDWADFYINLNRINETEAENVLIFTEKLVSENPQCLELMELLKESEKLFDDGKFEESAAKSKEVVEACRIAISKNEQTKYSKYNLDRVLYYAFFSALFIMIIWLVIYIYKRVKFNKDRYEGYV